MIAGAATDRRRDPGEEAPAARGVALLYLTVGRAAAGIGVLPGSLSASLTDRGDVQ